MEGCPLNFLESGRGYLGVPFNLSSSINIDLAPYSLANCGLIVEWDCGYRAFCELLKAVFAPTYALPIVDRNFGWDSMASVYTSQEGLKLLKVVDVAGQAGRT